MFIGAGVTLLARTTVASSWSLNGLVCVVDVLVHLRPAAAGITPPGGGIGN